MTFELCYCPRAFDCTSAMDQRAWITSHPGLASLPHGAMASFTGSFHAAVLSPHCLIPVRLLLPHFVGSSTKSSAQRPRSLFLQIPQSPRHRFQNFPPSLPGTTLPQCPVLKSFPPLRWIESHYPGALGPLARRLPNPHPYPLLSRPTSHH